MNSPLPRPLRVFGQFEIAKGKAKQVRELIQGGVDFVKENESGVLEFDFYINEHETMFCGIEVYRDSEALLMHMRNFFQVSGWVIQEEIIRIRRLDVFGNCTHELKQALEPLKANVFEYVTGFTR